MEAIVELRVENRPTLVVEELSDLAATDEEYLQPDPTFNIEHEIELVDGDIVGKSTGDQVGFAIRRRDGRRTIQANLDRFSYTWTAPYEDWHTFMSEALSAWRGYRELTQTQRVTHVGVRFINRIDVPKPVLDIKDYLRISVDVPPYLPQGVSRLFMQVDIPLESFGSLVTITSALADPPEAGTTSLILDIDAKRPIRLETDEPTFDGSLGATLADLRRAKNYVFEACITDATRGLIT